MKPLKCWTHYNSKSGKLSSGHRTGKSQFSFQSQIKAMSKNVQTIALISHAHKLMLKILQARFQQYKNQELPDVQAGFQRGRGTRVQIVTICWIIEKGKEFQKNIYFCFTDYVKTFDYVDHNKLRKILQEMVIPDHLTCFLRICMQVKKQQLDWTWNNGLVPNWERSKSRLYIITLPI